MKIVINKCYGGFGLSAKAYKRYLELKGKPCYFFAQKYSSLDKDRSYEEISLEDAINIRENEIYFHWSVFTTNKDVDKYMNDRKSWNILTEDEKDARNKFYNENRIYDGDIQRTDPDLIRVVEELGEEANGECANLEVIEIPDDIEWEINEYAGHESVHEKHRSWY